MSQRPELTGLRGFAAYVVVVGHASNATGLWGKLLGEGAGQVGVVLFFTLSGYLMSALYAGRPFTRANVFEFAVHRCARVLPLFYVILLSAFGVYLVTQLIGEPVAIYKVTPETFWWNFFLVEGSNVLWTIPIEVQFYALFVLLWAVGRYSSAAFTGTLLIGIIAGLAVRAGIAGASRALVVWLPYFLVGALIGHHVSLSEKTSDRATWSVAMIVALAGFVLLFPNVHQAIIGYKLERWLTATLSVVVISTLLIATLKAPIASRMFDNRFMQFSGQISYSVYLVHLFVILCLLATTSLDEWPVVFTLVALLITIGLATLTFYGIEWSARKAINGAFARYWSRPHAKPAMVEDANLTRPVAGNEPKEAQGASAPSI